MINSNPGSSFPGFCRSCSLFPGLEVFFPLFLLSLTPGVSSADWTLLVERLSGLPWALRSVPCVGSDLLLGPGLWGGLMGNESSSFTQALTMPLWSTNVLSSSFPSCYLCVKLMPYRQCDIFWVLISIFIRLKEDATLELVSKYHFELEVSWALHFLLY